MDQSLDALFLGKTRMDQWPWKFVKHFPEIGPWMTLPSLVPQSAECSGGRFHVLYFVIPN